MTPRVAYCDVCTTVFSLIGSVGESDSVVPMLGKSPPCPTSGCSGNASFSMTPAAAFDGYAKCELSPQAFFRASSGFEELGGREATFEEVSSMLIGGKITNVVGRTMGNPARAIIDSIEFEGGVRMNLAQSSGGASVYQIVNHASAAEKVLQDISNDSSE